MPFVGTRRWRAASDHPDLSQNWKEIMTTSRVLVLWRDGGELRIPIRALTTTNQEPNGSEGTRSMLEWLYVVLRSGALQALNEERKDSGNVYYEHPGPAFSGDEKCLRWKKHKRGLPTTITTQKVQQRFWSETKFENWIKWMYKVKTRANPVPSESIEQYWSLDESDLQLVFNRSLGTMERIMLHSGPWKSKNMRILLNEATALTTHIQSNAIENVTNRDLQLQSQSLGQETLSSRACAHDGSSSRILFVILIHDKDTAPWRTPKRHHLRIFDALLGSLYSTRHFYAFHVDHGASDEFFNKVLAIIEKHTNADADLGSRNFLVIPRNSSITGIWGSASLVWSDFITWTHAFRTNWDFDYIINLSARDIPLTSSKNITRILYESFPPFTSFIPYTTSNTADRSTYIYHDKYHLITNQTSFPLLYTHRKLLTTSKNSSSPPTLTLARGKQWYIMNVSLAKRIIETPVLIELLFSTQFMMVPDEMFWSTAAMHLGEDLEKLPRDKWGLTWNAWTCNPKLRQKIAGDLHKSYEREIAQKQHKQPTQGGSKADEEEKQELTPLWNANSAIELTPPLWIHRDNLRLANFTRHGVLLHEKTVIRLMESLPLIASAVRQLSITNNYTGTVAKFRDRAGHGGILEEWLSGLPTWNVPNMVLIARKSACAEMTCRMGYLSNKGLDRRQEAVNACEKYDDDDDAETGSEHVGFFFK
ncbi:hypothetical protein BJ742DRAFT_771636 [Cladochytrium replicatum]|nr:hypothetical protein BJ742DRAFT_771636 [Cladochytrium replicatum]